MIVLKIVFELIVPPEKNFKLDRSFRIVLACSFEICMYETYPIDGTFEFSVFSNRPQDSMVKTLLFKIAGIDKCINAIQ